jgi:hypothetical protein
LPVRGFAADIISCFIQESLALRRPGPQNRVGDPQLIRQLPDAITKIVEERHANRSGCLGCTDVSGVAVCEERLKRLRVGRQLASSPTRASGLMLA